tara:strand:- start:725 stop:931 length:207 start_codon:yes stop_codon:yes gene_type:complete
MALADLSRDLTSQSQCCMTPQRKETSAGLVKAEGLALAKMIQSKIYSAQWMKSLAMIDNRHDIQHLLN